MQRVLSIFMALCIGLTLSLDVHAKRFGGGKSFGSAPSHQTRQAPQQTQAAPNQAGNARGTRTPMTAHQTTTRSFHTAWTIAKIWSAAANCCLA